MSGEMVEPMFCWYLGFDLLAVNTHEFVRCRIKLEGPFVPRAITRTRDLDLFRLPRLGLRRCVRLGLLRSFSGGSAPPVLSCRCSVLRPLLRDVV